MKTNKILSIAFFSSCLALNAQEIQNRSISPFNKIEVHGSVNVLYTNSDSLSMKVKAKKNELENVETKVENGTLRVANKGNFSMPVYVYVKNNHLNLIQASGASVFKTLNALKEDSLVLSASSAANVNVMVNATRVKSVQSGASLLTLAGSTDVFVAELSGASSLKAYDLVSKTTDILATGASSSKIYVTDKLKANASGASNIKVRGEVTDISAEATSASSISRIADNGKNAGNDSTVYKWKGKKIIIIDKDDEGISIKRDSAKKFDSDDFRHWSGISMGVNGFMSSPGNIDLPANYGYMDLNYGRSFNFQFNLIERQFNIVRNNFKIVTGFGFDYHSYQLANKTNLDPDSSYTFGSIDSTNNYVYRKNRLRNTYLQVPLLFEFNTSNNPKKTFHLAFGVIGQYLIASRTRQILEQDEFELEKVRKDGYNMSPFAAKAHVNFGYKGWTLYGEYNLTPLFQSGKGPELYPFSVGLRVIPFT
ncbi:MAG TPA: DUF2807 domain-containing protein [Bacteroidia bacterium]|nr:DUF2807 domain-containing protein [Bacteroidia bacterium]